MCITERADVHREHPKEDKLEHPKEDKSASVCALLTQVPSHRSMGAFVANRQARSKSEVHAYKKSMLSMAAMARTHPNQRESWHSTPHLRRLGSGTGLGNSHVSTTILSGPLEAAGACGRGCSGSDSSALDASSGLETSSLLSQKRAAPDAALAAGVWCSACGCYGHEWVAVCIYGQEFEVWAKMAMRVALMLFGAGSLCWRLFGTRMCV